MEKEINFDVISEENVALANQHREIYKAIRHLAILICVLFSIAFAVSMFIFLDMGRIKEQNQQIIEMLNDRK